MGWLHKYKDNVGAAFDWNCMFYLYLHMTGKNTHIDIVFQEEDSKGES